LRSTLSIISADYTGPVPVITTSTQPSMEQGDPRPLDLPNAQLLVTALDEENDAELQGQSVPVSIIVDVAARSISAESNRSENASRAPNYLGIACCYVVSMIPAAVLIAIANEFPKDSIEYKVYFWSGIGYIPLITSRFFCACICGS